MIGLVGYLAQGFHVFGSNGGFEEPRVMGGEFVSEGDRFVCGE